MKLRFCLFSHPNLSSQLVHIIATGRLRNHLHPAPLGGVSVSSSALRENCAHLVISHFENWYYGVEIIFDITWTELETYIPLGDNLWGGNPTRQISFLGAIWSCRHLLYFLSSLTKLTSLISNSPVTLVFIKHFHNHIRYLTFLPS